MFGFDERIIQELRGPHLIDYSVSKMGALNFRKLIEQNHYLTALGALTGNQALQQAKAGLPFIYISGWQMAADNNAAKGMYPDLSLYPSQSGPELVKAINSTLLAATRQSFLLKENKDFLLPIMIDGEAGFGGVLNTFELTKQLIEAGVAAVHFEDQLPSAKRCGHLGGKVVVSTREIVLKLKACRLAAQICGVPLVIIGRTDVFGAKYIATDIDATDAPFIQNERSPDGHFKIAGDIEHAIARALKMAPFADMLWCESGTPNLHEAEKFATAIRAKYPKMPLVYNCSPSFRWQKFMSPQELAEFQTQLFALGYHVQLITLAGFHSLNAGMYELAANVSKNGLPAYVAFQEHEFKLETQGFSAIKHQQEVGVPYYDKLLDVITDGHTEGAMKGSTEENQF